MSTYVPIVVVLVGLGGLQAPGGGGQALQPATRLIEGRVTDVQGHPVREGKIMFALQNSPLGFDEAWAAAIDPEGHYRIELSTLSIGTEHLPANRQASLPRSRIRVPKRRREGRRGNRVSQGRYPAYTRGMAHDRDPPGRS